MPVCIEHIGLLLPHVSLLMVFAVTHNYDRDQASRKRGRAKHHASFIQLSGRLPVLFMLRRYPYSCLFINGELDERVFDNLENLIQSMD